jgi:hypothetical protein
MRGVHVPGGLWRAGLMPLCLLLFCRPSDQRFDSVSFRRTGGGDKAFYVKCDSLHDRLLFHVVRYDFRPANRSFASTVDDTADCHQLMRFMSGGAALRRGHKVNGLPTGTWVRIYAFRGPVDSVEILNEVVRKRLMSLEAVVEREMKEPGGNR